MNARLAQCRAAKQLSNHQPLKPPVSSMTAASASQARRQ
jgi:hypothetical protein